MQTNVSVSRRVFPAGKKIALALAVILAGFAFAPAWCDPGDQIHAPAVPPTPKPKGVGQSTEILLVMPSPDSEQEDVNKAIKEVKGTVVGTIGEGPLTVLMVKVEKGKLVETEKKLLQDKENFATVQRDYVYQVEQAPVNDPYFANEWHLPAINGVRAWDVTQGGSNVIAILDTGCNASIPDLAGKTYSGYDAIRRVDGQTDVQGHGTMVATSAAANTNNSRNTAALARRSFIYPVRVGTEQGGVSESAILQGIYRCGKLGIKIINISANASPPYSFANKSYHPALHTYLKWYHDDRGGLVFNSAGNDGQYDRAARVPYLIVVSALDNSYSLASFSTYGNPVWFTAPGTKIYCSTRTGSVASVAGTSFSSPICASVAGLIWGANPGLRNTDVERILVDTCYKVPNKPWTPYFGFGMPNAEAAARRALGR